MCRKEFVWNFEVEKVLNNNINFCVFVFTSPCFDMIFVCLFLIHSFSSFCSSYNKDCWRDAVCVHELQFRSHHFYDIWPILNWLFTMQVKLSYHTDAIAQIFFLKKKANAWTLWSHCDHCNTIANLNAQVNVKWYKENLKSLKNGGCKERVDKQRMLLLLYIFFIMYQCWSIWF